MSEWILTILIAVPLIGAVTLAVMGGPTSGLPAGRRFGNIALAFSGVTFLLTLLALRLFFAATGDAGRAADAGDFALVQNVSWIGDSRFLDFRYHVGVDGLSIWLLALTAFITPLAIWGSFTAIKERVKEYYVLLLLLEAGMIGVFAARDLLLFYIFFEFTLIPLFFLIGVWGGPERRRAAGTFFLYTFTGSMLTFAGVLYLAYLAYSMPASAGGVGVFTFDLEALYGLQLPFDVQWWLFLAFMAGFAIKVPLFPFHTWLPLAHTEAPTAGSVILAGVLLKLGTYGFMRFSLPMLPDASMHFGPLMATLAIIGVIYAALIAWVQQDVKKLVAYSSVSHLGMCMLGMFSLKTAGLVGSHLYMVNHGLSTGALFLVIGMMYERYHTREFDKIGGLARRMPWLAFFLVFFTLTSIGLPGLNGFVSEFLVLLGAFTSGSASDQGFAGPLNPWYGIFAATGIVLGAIYMLYMCRRVLFGPLQEPEHTPDTSAGLTVDLTGREIGILASIAVLCVVFGVYPKLLTDSITPAAEKQILARFEGVAAGASQLAQEDDLTPSFELRPTHAPAAAERHADDAPAGPLAAASTTELLAEGRR